MESDPSAWHWTDAAFGHAFQGNFGHEPCCRHNRCGLDGIAAITIPSLFKF